MDFKLTPEQEALKKDFEDFFEEEMKNTPKDWIWGLEGLYSDEGWPFNVYMAKRLAEKGWLVRPWPEEYGGCSAPMMEQLIFSDVIGDQSAPGVDPLGIGMSGHRFCDLGLAQQVDHRDRRSRGCGRSGPRPCSSKISPPPPTCRPRRSASATAYSPSTGCPGLPPRWRRCGGRTRCGPGCTWCRFACTISLGPWPSSSARACGSSAVAPTVGPW